MIAWSWTRENISPDDILGAAGTIPVTSRYTTMDLTSRWVPARRYLEWARAALERGGDDGWDTASSLAKRAACRQMDGILAHNHLGCLPGSSNYKDKSGFLAELKVPGLDLLRDLVIDPRNNIEHAYELATEGKAQQAFAVAELFIGATARAAEIPAIMSLGWNVNIRESNCTVPGKEYHILEIGLTKHHSPMLLISGYPEAPEVMVILPQEETLLTCPLKKFNSEHVITLNTKLRECLKSKNYDSRSLDEAFAKALREQLKLVVG